MDPPERQRRFWAFLLAELPYLALILLGLVGVSWTSISSAPTTRYWAIMTPIAAVICIAAGWSRVDEGANRFSMVVTQAVQWAAVLVAMVLVNISDVRSLLNVEASGLILLTLVALGVFISGLHLRAWKLSAVGVFLAVAVPVVAWVERAALLLLLIAAILIGLGFASWWVQARRGRPA